ncbi:MAG: aminoacyl-tRNA hydrolase [bacterium]|nr:aminoacyl-tRNA hydrolase [bacterium]
MINIIIIGLGNPGKKYINTRHNIGFEIIDVFTKENNFPEFRLNKKFNALISEKENILLVKPQTFMNESGISVKKLAGVRPPLNQRGSDPRNLRNLYIIHDDIDLPLGKIRISKNRGSAGHKGVESIIKELGTKDFLRIRIGIRPLQRRELIYGAEKFVLEKFKKEEKELLNQAVRQALIEIKKLS